jgi:hypothetical protein
MSVLTVMPVMVPAKSLWAVIALIFLSSFVIAETIEHLQSDAKYDELARQEIFDSNTELRLDLPPENEWRAQQPVSEPKSRIQYGADPDYEEIKARDQSLFDMQQHEFGSERPTAILRFKF